MNDLFQIYVISLESSQRWPAQAAMLQRLGISAQRWPAVDGRQTPLPELENFWVADNVLKQDSDIMRSSRPDAWKQAVIGLLASSALLWRHISLQDNEWSLILEDDCELHPDLADSAYVRAMWARLPDDAEFVYFGVALVPYLIHRVADNVGKADPISGYCHNVNPFFVRMHTPIFGSYAYAVRKRLLPKLLATLPTTCPIDNFHPDHIAMYALKGSDDWFRRLPTKDQHHRFWGMAAPRDTPSTIQ